MKHLYQIPFNFQQLIPPPISSKNFGIRTRENQRQDYSLEASIDQHIRLLLSTPKGAFHYDPAFGCDLWEMDFVNNYLPSENDWKRIATNRLKKNIETYEPRLQNIEISELTIEENGKVTIQNYLKNIEIPKRMISIDIQAQIAVNGKAFEKTYTLCMSPIFVQ